MLVYKIFPNTKKIIIKILHAILHVGVMAFAIAGLIAAFDSHNKKTTPIPNMYSLHSWIGLSAVILFGLQWVAGFVSFLFPRLSDGLRAAYLSYHKYWGIAIFVMVIAAALMGITEKAFFSLGKEYFFLNFLFHFKFFFNFIQF